MCPYENYILINGVRFRDVTDQTIAGHVMSYAEALAYTQGRDVIIYQCPQRLPPPECKRTPFYSELPKFKKRKHRVR